MGATKKTETFLARLRKRGQITMPPEYVEALELSEGDMLKITVSLERRRNDNEKTKK